MKVGVLGGGPAGLYLALLLRKDVPGAEVTVFERNPRGATYGWGVVFSDRTLGSFRTADPRSYNRITDELIVWDSIDVRVGAETIRAAGQVFSGISRKKLLLVLQQRCEELGVELCFDTEVTDLGRVSGHDLVVAADGVNSVVRSSLEERFRPAVRLGSSRYIWLGTRCTFDSFTFIFRANEHGLFQVHAYPFDGDTSTFIVECDEHTWRAAGLDRAGEAESIAYCERLFAPDLRGNSLLGNRSAWLAFPTLTTKTWRAGNVVLVGDSAHTAHFSIGSGTKLAMEDSISLAAALHEHGSIEVALTEYEADRRPRVERFQEAARQSQAYFEDTRRYLHMEPLQFAFHLLSRSGRMDYTALRLRDPALVERVDAWFAGGSLRACPPPALNPMSLRGLELPNRIVSAPEPAYSCSVGLASVELRDRLEAAAAGGPGLVVTQPVAVEPEGRITPGCPGLWSEDHVAALRAVLPRRAGCRMGICLTHAGRRAATCDRTRGSDRPLPGGWRAVAASPIAYSRHLDAPAELDRAGMERVREAFAAAATRAGSAGFDLVEIDMSHGYLLSGFLSPAANLRTDGFGGSLEGRLRFPLEVLESVREAWAGPLVVALNGSDWERGGSGPDEAEAVASALAGGGADLVRVVAGQQSEGCRPSYDPYVLTDLSDRIRNGARVPTLATAGYTTLDEIHGVIAGGRADMCLLERL